MKKIIILIMTIFIGLCLCACGNSTGSAQKYQIGDTVETESVKLKLNNAKFAVALNNTLGSTYLEPKEYTDKDLKNPYVANDGSILVYYDITISAIGRNSVSVDNDDLAILEYRGKTYKAKVGSNYSGNSDRVANVFVSAGETERVKVYFEIPVRAEVNEDFTIIFTLPDGTDAEQKFSFAIDGNYDYAKVHAKDIEIVEALNDAWYYLDFTARNAGNNINGKLKFSDDILIPLINAWNGLDESYIKEHFPNLMEKLPELRENTQTVWYLLIEMGATNSSKDVSQIKKLARSTCNMITEIIEEDFVDYN